MIIIDRRDTYQDRAIGSRQRFTKRYKNVLKGAVDKAVGDSKGITDIIGKNGQPVTIPKKGISEPIPFSQRGGIRDTIYSGNDDFIVGDKFRRPPGGSGGAGRGGSDEDDGSEDDFSFVMSKEEFMDLLFEDLELPDLVKKNILNTNTRDLVHSGFAKSGPPGMMDIIRSYKNSLGRRIGLNRKAYEEKLAAIQSEMENLDVHSQEWRDLANTRDRLLAKKRSIPLFDEIDLRFRQKDWENKPTVSAVMFAVMDVSGSMTEQHKTVAKMFFMLLYLFLQRNYKNIQIVFIRHTSEAKEVDEQEFFHGRETGGTVVSSALELCYDIIKERYDSAEWNIYIAQASDGDNFTSDNARCETIIEKLKPLIQYMVYIQVDVDWAELVYRQKLNREEPEGELWQLYKNVSKSMAHFAMRVVGAKQDIYPVFRELFEKKR